MSEISYYSKRGNETDRRARLLAGSLADVARLEEAKLAGWDVEKELEQAYLHVKAFSEDQ